MIRVLSSVPDPRFGGPSKRSLSVAQVLREDGVDTVFLIPRGDDGFAEAAISEGFDTVRIRQPRIRSPRRIRDNVQFLFDFPSSTKRIQNIIGGNDIDLTHVNGPLNYSVALAARRSDSALLWHFNDTLTPTPLKQLSAAAARRWADSIAVAANRVHDEFFDESVPSETLYPPVDTDRFDSNRFERDETRSALGIEEDEFVVGTIGNLNPVKGHDYLLRAIAMLNDRVGNLRLLIVGGRLDSQPQYYRKLTEMIETHDLDNVDLLGYRSDTPEILSAIDLFVLPSISEACPIVNLEAMAMRTPIVTTNVGGIPEQIPDEEFGWLVPPEDSNALADGIESAINQPAEKRRRANRARERVVQRFSLERCAERHLEVYRRVLDIASESESDPSG